MTELDEEGLPQRDYQSTSYVAGFEAAPDFMVRVRQEAIRRRMAAALLLVPSSRGLRLLPDHDPVGGVRRGRCRS